MKTRLNREKLQDANRKSQDTDRRLDLIVEPLETRWMLAGMVTVVASNQDVELTGDSLGNEIDITRAGSVLTIDGQNGTSLSFNGNIVNSVNINLGADQTIDRDLRIRLLDGADIVVLDDVQVARNLFVDLGRGDDTFDDANGSYQGRAILKGGGGAFRDRFEILNSDYEGPVIAHV